MDTKTHSKYKCSECGGEFSRSDVLLFRDYKHKYYVCWKCNERGKKLVSERHMDFLHTYKGRQLGSRHGE